MLTNLRVRNVMKFTDTRRKDRSRTGLHSSRNHSQRLLGADATLMAIEPLEARELLAGDPVLIDVFAGPAPRIRRVLPM